jgi:hypothetical protein
MPDEPVSVEFDMSALDAAVGKYPDFLDRMMELTSLFLLASVQKEAPVKEGRLSGSYQQERLGPISFAVGSNVPYRWAVIGGTRPHEIEARNAKALHFNFPAAGGWVFFKRVQHPGTQPNDFVSRAIELTEQRVPDLAQNVIQEKML